MSEASDCALALYHLNYLIIYLEPWSIVILIDPSYSVCTADNIWLFFLLGRVTEINILWFWSLVNKNDVHGVIEPSYFTPQFLSSCFLVPKKAGCARPILNTMVLNLLSISSTFMMIVHSFEEGLKIEQPPWDYCA